jgi:hypothetical protein
MQGGRLQGAEHTLPGADVLVVMYSKLISYHTDQLVVLQSTLASYNTDCNAHTATLTLIQHVPTPTSYHTDPRITLCIKGDSSLTCLS